MIYPRSEGTCEKGRNSTISQVPSKQPSQEAHLILHLIQRVLLRVTVAAAALVCPDNTACANGAWTQFNPPLPLRNQTPSAEKQHTAVLGLGLPQNVFIVSDVSFAEGSVVPAKETWSRAPQTSHT